MTEPGVPTKEPWLVRSALGRILVAEDDPVYRHLLQKLLERASFAVTSVADGEAALRAAQAENAPRLLILDWMMPGMSGIDVCRQLRKEHTLTLYQYIILLTARDAKTDTIAGLEAGADDYLTKPVDYQELLARLRAGTRILELQDRCMKVQQELEYQATHDALTGLWNRPAWKNLLTAEFERAYRNATSVAVLMIDLDHFKAINDTYGHYAGDILLNKVGDVLRSLVRAYDHAGRYGGDEFIVVAQDLSQDGSYDFAERIRSTLAQTTVSHEGSVLSANVTIGIAFAESLHDRSPNLMVRLADRALYDAKAKGRNCVSLSCVPSTPAGSTRKPAEELHVT